MKKIILLSFIALSIMMQSAYAQVVITDNPPAMADPSAILDLQSDNKGFLFPRMTESERDNISNPPNSLVVFQTDNTQGLYYNIGTAGSPVWEKITDETNIGSYWTSSGTDLYYNTGNVGIGTTSPAALLEIDGRPGHIFIDAETNYAPKLSFAYEGSEMFFHDIVNITGVEPYWSMSSAIADDFWMIRRLGRLWHNYQGSTSAYVLLTAAESRALSIVNSAGAGEARGIQVSMSNTSNISSIIAVGGWSAGLGTGIYGQNDNPAIMNYGHVGTQYHGVYGQHGMTENRGSLGASSYGVYGRTGALGTYYWGAIGLDGGTNWGVYGSQGNVTSPNFGGIGSDLYGVYGEYGDEDFFGILGASSSGVYGALGGSTQDLDPGDYAIKGLGVQNSGESGTAYGYGATIGAVTGYNPQGTAYSFGVAGYTEMDPDKRAGGVLGAFGNAIAWGSLAYKDNSGAGTRYGGYFTSTQTGPGKANTDPASSIGIGVYGDLFGAKINGNVYGLYAEGENYGIYAHGDMYRTGADVHLQQDNTGQNNVMYTLVSTEMTIQTYGVGQMQNGKATINFDDAFANVVSSTEPIIVTVTPMGQTKGVYLKQVNGNSFSLAENDNGKSSVQFSWIAIGKRKGFENMSLPADVIASDYNEKIQRGLVNDADLNAQGEGLYFQNGTLHNGQLPQTRNAGNNIVPEPVKNLEPFVVDDAMEASNKLPMQTKVEEVKDEIEPENK